MKKILLGTTALVATGLTAGAANAAALKVDVNGYYTGVVAAVDTDVSVPLASFSGDPLNTDDVQVSHEGEISINGSVTLDNGLTAGVEINIEATNDASGFGTSGIDGVAGIDEAYAYLEGSFGRVQIGSEGSAPFLMHFSAPYFVGSHGVDSPNFLHANTGTFFGAPTASNITPALSFARITRARTSTYITLSGDNNKVTYFSPRFSGVQLGVSYTPDNLGNRDVGGQFGGVSNAFGNTSGQTGAANLENILEVGANYTGTFSNVGVGASIGYAQADTEDAPGGGSAGVKDPEVWSFGLQLTSGAFTLGGGYYMSENLATVVPSGAADLEEKAWSVALQYETGPWTVGAGYFESESETGAATKDEYDVIEVGATYALGDGVDVFAVAEFYETQGDTAVTNLGALTAGNLYSIETDAVAVGIDLAF
ncbi:MAG: porin [Alphaproteobacteria bacterium]